MRYQIGETHYFVDVRFDPVEPRAAIFRPWKDHLKEIVLYELRCLEHHKVAWDQDPHGEKKHDGFVFLDETENRRWTNQYPTASYGQLDDSADRRVVRDHDELMDIHGDADTAIQAYPSNEVFWGISDILKTIEDVLSATNSESISYLGDNMEQEMRALDAFKIQLIEAVQKKSGKVVDIRPWVFTKKTGGTHSVPGVLQATLRETEAV